MTILKFLLGGAVAIAGAAALPSQSKASEWGCQVLNVFPATGKAPPRATREFTS